MFCLQTYETVLGGSLLNHDISAMLRCDYTKRKTKRKNRKGYDVEILYSGLVMNQQEVVIGKK